MEETFFLFHLLSEIDWVFRLFYVSAQTLESRNPSTNARELFFLLILYLHFAHFSREKIQRIQHGQRISSVIFPGVSRTFGEASRSFLVSDEQWKKTLVSWVI